MLLYTHPLRGTLSGPDRYYWIRNFFFPDTASVHTYLFVGESGIRIRNFYNPLSRVEILEYAMNPESCGR